MDINIQCLDGPDRHFVVIPFETTIFLVPLRLVNASSGKLVSNGIVMIYPPNRVHLSLSKPMNSVTHLQHTLIFMKSCFM